MAGHMAGALGLQLRGADRMVVHSVYRKGVSEPVMPRTIGARQAYPGVSHHSGKTDFTHDQHCKRRTRRIEVGWQANARLRGGEGMRKRKRPAKSSSTTALIKAATREAELMEGKHALDQR